MFEELSKDFETTPEEQKNLPKLRDSKGWRSFKAMTERYVLKLVYNLVAGSEWEKDLAKKELDELRGFVRYWKKIVGRVEFTEPKKDENQNK